MSYSDSLETYVIDIMSSKNTSCLDIDNRNDRNYIIKEDIYQLYIKLYESNYNIIATVNKLN